VASRYEDWLSQAKRDLASGRHATQGGFHEWAFFAAQQGAEKAVTALYQKIEAEAWGHSITAMLQALPSEMRPHQELMNAARLLDRHYIGPRYPNSVPAGFPGQFYTGEEAHEALAGAEVIVQFCEDHILR